MNSFRADLHIHSVLSPCGDLEMSPLNIVNEASGKGLGVIAVTDHNHTGHSRLVRQLGEEKDIFVVYGVEITTIEEVHCLAFFDNDEQIAGIQTFILDHLPVVENDADLLGEQVVVDREERILEVIGNSLYPGIQKSLMDVCDYVHQLGGLFVPAHVDRLRNGLYSQLGFMPEELEADAIEIFRKTETKEIIEEHPELSGFQLMKNSDAHFAGDIGRSQSRLIMKARNFTEFGLALRGRSGREVIAI